MKLPLPKRYEHVHNAPPANDGTPHGAAVGSGKKQKIRSQGVDSDRKCSKMGGSLGRIDCRVKRKRDEALRPKSGDL
ncbi:hypothetical protein GCM10008101_19350 [Lysobacter xinjiangensis]|uniref:Uncharacterized protein n=1 Tax=Cognatilysobacter xinjiangensis TaxID=546892 RepID=A0ABQ3C698_9GAMM|nr:hypothetical protein GCM10008101_19350 [Lysobacter xinjiangensis]